MKSIMYIFVIFIYINKYIVKKENMLATCARLLRSRGSTSSLTKAPVFQRVPPWWAQWTLGLIACDIFMTFVHFNISADIQSDNTQKAVQL